MRLIGTTSKGWRSITASDPCVYCVLGDYPQRTRDRMTIEHVLPIKSGGRRSGWENMASAHKSCNHERSAMPLLLFLLVKLRLRALPGKANHSARRAVRRQFNVAPTVN